MTDCADPAARPLPGELREVCVPVTTLWSSPEAPRRLDTTAVQGSPDAEAWPQALSATGRLGLHGRTLTQALLGEPVRVLQRRGAWVEVTLPWQPSIGPGGYRGWLRRHHLAAPVAVDSRTTATLTRGSARCRLDEGRALRLSFGTVCGVDVVTDEEVAVLLPGGRRGWLALGDVRLTAAPPGTRPEGIPPGATRPAGPTPTTTSPPGTGTGPPVPGAGPPAGDAGAAALAAARRLQGVAYLWGGLSSWGVDCSGLVHLAYRTLGISLPRDAAEQAADVDRVQPIAPDHAAAGDLYFFARAGEAAHHVGLAVTAPGGLRMLHAPEAEGHGRVEEVDLDPARRRILVGAGRVRR